MKKSVACKKKYVDTGIHGAREILHFREFSYSQFGLQ